MRAPYTYEIEFNVIGSARDEYETWVEQESLEWVTHESVTQFSVRYNEFSPEVKFVFGFSSLDAWAVFLDSAEHERTKEALQGMVTEVEETVWEQGGLTFEGTSTPPNERTK